MDKAISRFGGSPKTLADFKALCESEYQVQYNAMVEEYKAKKAALIERKERRVAEFQFLADIVELNTLQLQNANNPQLLLSVEQSIANLNMDNVAASYTLNDWRAQYGEGLLVPLVSDILNYFIQQFEVKEKLSHQQMYQLSLKLIAAQPHLRIRELLFVLREALAGNYGPTYERVGINRVLAWVSRYYDDSCTHLEQRMINEKPEEARGDKPWETLQKRLQAFKTEQERKRDICKSVWESEQRKEEIEEYKRNLKGE